MPLTRRDFLRLGVAGAVACLPGCGSTPAPTSYSYELVHTFPHDPTAFTQGLLFADGILYESTGQLGESTLRRVELTTGRVLHSVALPEAYFGEGLALWGERLLQLTWQNHIGLIYDKNTLQRTGSFSVAGDGWGLTHNGQHLILSDGSATLQFLDPQTYSVVRRQEVVGPGGPQDQLNELEYFDGALWANVWHTDRIARIDPGTGRITGWVDLTGLRPASTAGEQESVLNGIAYDEAGRRLLVTGKRWPSLFEIRLVARAG